MSDWTDAELKLQDDVVAEWNKRANDPKYPIKTYRVGVSSETEDREEYESYDDVEIKGNIYSAITLFTNYDFVEEKKANHWIELAFESVANDYYGNVEDCIDAAVRYFTKRDCALYYLYEVPSKPARITLSVATPGV